MKKANLMVTNTPDLTEEAYHLAGQVVAARRFGLLRESDRVRLTPDARSLWGFHYWNKRMDERAYETGAHNQQYAAICLAGNAARCRYLKTQGKTFLGGEEDRRRAVE